MLPTGKQLEDLIKQYSGDPPPEYFATPQMPSPNDMFPLGSTHPKMGRWREFAPGDYRSTIPDLGVIQPQRPPSPGLFEMLMHMLLHFDPAYVMRVRMKP